MKYRQTQHDRFRRTIRRTFAQGPTHTTLHVQQVTQGQKWETRSLGT
jgi:hypothetical protein